MNTKNERGIMPVLLILVVAGILLLTVGKEIVVRYGSAAPILAFVLSASAVIAVHYLGAIDLNEDPFMVLIPFIIFIAFWVGVPTIYALLLIPLLFIVAIAITIAFRRR